jgi:SAM-dependent methyltransferase
MRSVEQKDALSGYMEHTRTDRPRSEVEPQVRAQYVAYPYPNWNPGDDFLAPSQPQAVNLPILNHMCFAGMQAFEDFSVLEAGCGTGSAALYFARMFKKLPGTQRVVAIDISEHSLQILRERMKLYGLVEDEDIEVIHGSILDIPDMELGLFDVVESTGVLHHLHSPEAGLQALERVLKPNGAMNIMVYGETGRIPTTAGHIITPTDPFNPGWKDLALRMLHTPVGSPIAVRAKGHSMSTPVTAALKEVIKYTLHGAETGPELTVCELMFIIGKKPAAPVAAPDQVLEAARALFGLLGCQGGAALLALKHVRIAKRLPAPLFSLAAETTEARREYERRLIGCL